MTQESKKKEEIQLFPVKPLVSQTGDDAEDKNLVAEDRLYPNISYRTEKTATAVRRMSMNPAEQYHKKPMGLGEGAGELSTFQEKAEEHEPSARKKQKEFSLTHELTLFHGPIEEHELKVRQQQTQVCWTRYFTTLMAAIMVFAVYLITLETLLSSALCVGLTIYWYETVSSITGYGICILLL